MIVAIIQARMSSHRLPNKVLMEINSKPMLWHVINRTMRAKHLEDIVVATTTKIEDKPITQLAKSLGVKAYRGSEDDVLDRYYKAATRYDADPIIRITSDCPLIDPSIIDRTIEYFFNNAVDYASHAIDGFDVEVFSCEVLAAAWVNAEDKHDREHVTPFIIRNFKTGYLAYPNPSIHLSVDTEEDLNLVRSIYKRLGNDFGMQDVLKFMEEEE